MKKIIAFCLVAVLAFSPFGFAFDDTLITTTPAGSDDPKQGDDRIRELKAAFVQRLDVDHNMPQSATDTYDGTLVGYHRKMTLMETDTPTALDNAIVFYAQETDVTDSNEPGAFFITQDGETKQWVAGKNLLLLLNEISSGLTTEADQGALYTKETGSPPHTQLFYRSETSGPETQITSSGTLFGAATADENLQSWCKIDGTSGSLTACEDGFNVSSITDNGTGDYTITWDTDFTGTTYSITCMPEEATAAENGAVCFVQAGTQAAGSFDLNVTVSGSGTHRDHIVYIHASGDQ